MKSLLRWVFFIFLFLLALGVAGILLLDTVAKAAMESQIRAKTGMDAKIGKVSIGLVSPTVSIENLKLYNTAEFGGSPFIDLPELFIEYDRSQLRNRQLHFRLLRLNLAEVSILTNNKGRVNIGNLPQRSKTPGGAAPSHSINKSIEFAGIDTLNLTLGKARIGKVDAPTADREIDFGIKNQVFHNIKSLDDLRSLALALATKSDARFLAPAK